MLLSVSSEVHVLFFARSRTLPDRAVRGVLLPEVGSKSHRVACPLSLATPTFTTTAQRAPR